MSRKKHEGESKDTKRTDNDFAMNCILSKKFGIDELQHHFFRDKYIHGEPKFERILFYIFDLFLHVKQPPVDYQLLSR